MNRTLTRWVATVTVRVPDGDDSDLTTCACQRLASPAAIRAVEVTGIRGIEPRLSATVVTVDVAVETGERDRSAVSHALERAPGTQQVDRLNQK